jgi:hypothetical protein
MLEVNYGKPENRYGVGQFTQGNMRMYTAGGWGPASVNLSIARAGEGEGNFDDIVKVKTDGSTSVKGTLFTGDNAQEGWTGVNLKRRDGRWTHFDWVGDQKNYIRGDTIVDGSLVVNGKDISAGAGSGAQGPQLPDPRMNSIGRDDGDWFRIYGTPGNGTALHNGMAINHNGGLAVGSWSRPPTGDIEATGNITGRGLNITNGNGSFTHFNHANTSKNFIRGDTHVDGKIFVNEICDPTGKKCIKLNFNDNAGGIGFVNPSGASARLKDDGWFGTHKVKNSDGWVHGGNWLAP